MDDPRREISPISCDVRVRTAAYIGILAAYWAAVKSDPLTPIQIALFVLAAGWSLGFEHRFRKPFFSSPIKIGLIVFGSIIFVMFITGYVGGSTTEHFANSIARFLFWNGIVFILSRNKSEYDLWTLAIIELSLFMISGAFIQPPDFLPLLLISTASLLYTFHRSAFLRCGPAAEVTKGGTGLMITNFILVVEIAAIVFLVFPRLTFRMDPAAEEEAATELPDMPEGAPVATSGSRTGIPSHPEFLDLTNLDKLKLDPQQVMHVRVTDSNSELVPPLQTLYLRGAVLDTYQNGKWRTRFVKRRHRDEDDGFINGWTPLASDVPPGRKRVIQEIVTTAFAGDLTFSLPDPVRVKWSQARYDPSGMLFFAKLPDKMSKYYVESALMPIDVPDVRRLPEAHKKFLQLPAGLRRVRETARLVGRGRESRPHVRVSRLVQYLMHNGFQYKLDPFVPTEGMDPVEYFLQKREGYCTHYATALALLCRASGLPARVATGFQLHGRSEDGWFRVKNSDAHAWVEVWYGPEFGWRAYDATPDEGRGPALPQEGDPVATVEPDIPEEGDGGPAGRWDDFVRQFDPQAQNAALGKIVAALGTGLVIVGEVVVSPWVLGTILALFVGGIVTYFLLPKRARHRFRQMVSGFKERARVDFYRDFLWALSRRGIRKHPALTPHEFARIARERISDDGIEFVTGKFYEALYRATPPTDEERRRIDEIIERLMRPDTPKV